MVAGSGAHAESGGVGGSGTADPFFSDDDCASDNSSQNGEEDSDDGAETTEEQDDGDVYSFMNSQVPHAIFCTRIFYVGKGRPNSQIPIHCTWSLTAERSTNWQLIQLHSGMMDIRERFFWKSKGAFFYGTKAL